MIKSEYIKEKIKFVNPDTNQEEEYFEHFEYYESKTNKLLGKVFKKGNPYTYYFIPEIGSNLSSLKVNAYDGGGQKLYLILCRQLEENYKKL